MKRHLPVLIDEIIEILNPQKKQKFIDATVGDGGYSEAISKKTSNLVKILCLDQNKESLQRAKRFIKEKKNIIFVQGNFRKIKTIALKNGFSIVDGIVYDLGLASWQISSSGLGISFSKNEKLDMRLQDQLTDKKIRLTATELLNKFPVKKIAQILYQYADVKGSWNIARRIEIARRKKRILTTYDLVEIVGNKNPKILAPIFQALRIYINDEYKNLEISLEKAIDLLKKDGKAIVVSYHSGEDRIVKNLFKKQKKENAIEILTKKPLAPSQKEIKLNPSARSAKLRVLKKI